MILRCSSQEEHVLKLLQVMVLVMLLSCSSQEELYSPTQFAHGERNGLRKSQLP